MSVTGHWIDGKDVIGNGATIPVINPATEQVIGEFREADDRQVQAAVAAARRSFEARDWSNTPVRDRQALLRRVAQAIRDDIETLTDLQVKETGLIPAGVRMQILGSAGWFDYFADFLSGEHGSTYRQLEAATTLVEREPIGVCALFSPWNVPVGLSAIKLAPALAAGNSIILKPSEETPLVTRRLVDLVNSAGLPAGGLHSVHGRGTTTGAALANAQDIDMISYTGGHMGGRAVAEAAARLHIPCVMELGGKSATIIFDDADLEAAIDGALISAYGNNGQACLAGSRILLHSSIADAFIAGFRARAEAMKLGNPAEDGTTMGPMISAAHRDRVHGFYESAVADGDEILFGNAETGLDAGFFLRPGAIKPVSRESRIWTEEVFGPIAAITTFDTEDEAVAKANDSAFGLSGYLWTSDIGRAMRVAKRLRTGTIVINSTFLRELNAPFGGYKASGVGREGGEHSWNNFTELKTTVIRHG